MKKDYLLFAAAIAFLICLFAIYKLHERIQVLDYNNQRAINSINQALREEALFEVTEINQGRRKRLYPIRGDRKISKLTFTDGVEKAKDENWSYKILDQGIAVLSEKEIVFYPYSSIKKINFQTDLEAEQ